MSVAVATGCAEPPAVTKAAELGEINTAASAAPVAKAADTAKKATDDVMLAEYSERVKPPSTADQAALQTAGQELDDTITRARKDLVDHDGKKATAELASARRTIEKIGKLRPTVEVTQTVWDLLSNKPPEKQSETLPADVVPIVKTLSSDTEYVADPDAVAKLGEDGKVPVELVDSAVLYSEIDLPLAATRVHVAAAERFISEGKLDEAEKTLADVGVVMSPTIFESDAPIIMARRAAVAARKAFAEGDLLRTRWALRAAHDALDSAKSGADTDAAKRAYASLSEELGSLDRGLKAGQQAKEMNLQHVVEGVAALARYQTMRDAAAGRLSKERAALSVGLLDVELARSVGRIAPSTRGTYLSAARERLEEAGKVADADTSARVDFARAQLAKLEVAQGESDRAELTASLTANLRDLVYQIRPQPGDE
ncbi:MAG: YfdX family protein [Polyangiaceae bacterium]